MNVRPEADVTPSGPWRSVRFPVTGDALVELSDNPARVDFQALWVFLSTSAYWARWRDEAIVAKQVEGAWRVVSAHLDGRMVGFARAVSDGVALAYLADVYVLPEMRGLGVGKALLGLMIDEGPGAEFRWMLHTRDAHTLYSSFGFLEPPESYMERPAKLPVQPTEQ